MFYKEGNVFNTILRLQTHSRSVLVINTKCKYNFTRKLHRVPLLVLGNVTKHSLWLNGKHFFSLVEIILIRDSNLTVYMNAE